jgi:hypothetical protein
VWLTNYLHPVARLRLAELYPPPTFETWCLINQEALFSSVSKVISPDNVTLKKLTVAQPAIKFPVFYGKIHYVIYSIHSMEPMENKDNGRYTGSKVIS